MDLAALADCLIGNFWGSHKPVNNSSVAPPGWGASCILQGGQLECCINTPLHYLAYVLK